MSGKKLADIFKGRRKETEKPEEEDSADDNNKPSPGYDDKIHNYATNEGRLHHHKKSKMRANRADTVIYLKDMDEQ